MNQGICWRVGDGESIWVASDLWIPKPHSFIPLMRHGAPNVKVSELISPNKHGWIMEVVEAMVDRADVDIIGAIPISRQGCRDKRIWHYTKNGIDSVRSGYFAVMEMLQNGEFGRKGGGMSSLVGEMRGIWKKTWSPLVLKKLWLFIWKACRKTLAVRHNLEGRRIQVINKCDLCGMPNETEAHLFFRCEFARAFWFGTSVQIEFTAIGVVDFLEGWQRLVERLEKEVDDDSLLQQVVFGFWRIWKCWNDVVFSRTRILPHTKVELWRKQLDEFTKTVAMDEGGTAEG